ncbi:His-Xaa-Ser system protein HxsD [Cupriavidus necator]|uniref:His-Xaa-Ser system protein HxsD n=1 Tax=Cupriavidus necator (strain ATCC 17699 / DSM 428 / KCTC 22496 / NCIMB 10442 / H16 / Stanier 337) TaxID=381666 RepID=A0AAE5ZI48_CUPNH|nr:His-Xaa-Ser system protein HxsD [Cupriavidus necator]QCC03179.1 His-Xaa-Ser system protein HxsD [Cupriavidus necator H16]QQB80235.1 His-Xaa-Ser system protein HxsD [Cupriavidus necator]WKA44505.1 His-Xaa-Ser system protein HxsD [Cupriavidus necator]
MTTRLELDSAVYCLEAVQKAAYRFIDRLTVLISQSPTSVVCEIELVGGIAAPLEDVLANFKRELLDQQLRLQIKNETEAARNLILAYAFSRTGLQQ